MALWFSKYPPAEPGALGLQPLEAAGPCCINPHSNALRNASPGTECASRTSLPHFLVDRPFAVVWLHFSWRPIGGTPFMRLAAHCLETRPRTEGADFGICQTFAASPAEPGELPCWFRPRHASRRHLSCWQSHRAAVQAEFM